MNTNANLFKTISPEKISVGKGLVNRDNTLEVQRLSRFQGGPKLCGMVGVLMHRGTCLGRLEIFVPGRHNVL